MLLISTLFFIATASSARRLHLATGDEDAVMAIKRAIMERKSANEPKSFVEKCTQLAKMDLQIIVDSSASVGEENFRTMMEQISSSLVDKFEIGADKTRVALFKYSSTKVLKNEFGLSAYSSKKEVRKKIESTEFEAGWTMTAMAMKEALTFFKKEQRTRDTARVCLIFTDGDATDREEVAAARESWTADGVTVFAVGIGSDLSRAGLREIAGEDKRAFEVANFDAIASAAKSLLKEVCKEVAPTAAPTSAPITLAPTTVFPARNVGQCRHTGDHLRDPEDCAVFWVCEYIGTRYAKITRMHCPANLKWNVAAQTCDWPGNVDCEA